METVIVFVRLPNKIHVIGGINQSEDLVAHLELVESILLVVTSQEKPTISELVVTSDAVRDKISSELISSDDIA